MELTIIQIILLANLLFNLPVTIVRCERCNFGIEFAVDVIYQDALSVAPPPHYVVTNVTANCLGPLYSCCCIVASVIWSVYMRAL